MKIRNAVLGLLAAAFSVCMVTATANETSGSVADSGKHEAPTHHKKSKKCDPSAEATSGGAAKCSHRSKKRHSHRAKPAATDSVGSQSSGSSSSMGTPAGAAK